MNGNEFSRLSYKELQALALRYRVPGNIKKKLLVKVLQAAKGGNANEVERLLQDLKQNRKKRVRKLKSDKLGLTSTPLHSPSYVMAEDYYCPQQPPAYQWSTHQVAAEEEIASREEEGRIPHYDEFKQFLMRKIQKDFRNFDGNNNPLQEPTIVDLRTVGVSTNVQSRALDNLDPNDYTRSNILAVNNPEEFVYQSNDRVEYHTIENVNANNGQGSILLKKMLQAPAGANLEEIASPVMGGYRMWPVEHYQSTNLLDNSDTLTAESDTQDIEGILHNSTEYYGVCSNVRGEYFLQEPTFVRNVEEIGQQISNVLNNESNNQYKYPGSGMDGHQVYENWNLANAVDPTEAHCPAPDAQSSRIFQTMYYENVRPDNVNKPTQDENVSPYQYHLMENVQSPYRTGQNLLNLNTCEEVQYCDTSVITSIQSDSSNNYYLQNLTKYNNEPPGDYYNNVTALPSASAEPDAYANVSSQVVDNNNQCDSTVYYEYPYVNHASNAGTSEKFDQNQENNNMVVNREDETTVEFPHEKSQGQNGTLGPFWPKWFSSASEPVLDNILNLHCTKRIDLTRLEQTSCVYCYMAPIVTHSIVPPGSVCSQKEKFIAEYRQHSFTPYWLLYNDTTEVSRQKLQEHNPISSQENMETLEVSSGNSEIRSRVGSEGSINEGCLINYETGIEPNENVCEEMNVESTECLFPAISTDPLDISVNLTMGAP